MLYSIDKYKLMHALLTQWLGEEWFGKGFDYPADQIDYHRVIIHNIPSYGG